MPTVPATLQGRSSSGETGRKLCHEAAQGIAQHSAEARNVSCAIPHIYPHATFPLAVRRRVNATVVLCAVPYYVYM